ncbi:hypothetical protein Tco_1346845 [Tanacetum coccineum]
MDQYSAYMVAASKVPMLKPETTIAPAIAEEKAPRSWRFMVKVSYIEEELRRNVFDKSKCELLTTAQKDTLQGSAGLQRNQENRNRKTQEGLESIESRLLVYKKNESVYEEDIKVLKREIYLREVAITELRRKLELAQKQKDEIHLTVENFVNSSINLSKLIDCQIVDKCKTVKKHVVKTSKSKPKVVRKNNGAPIIEDWVSDSEEEDVPQAKIEKKTVKPSFAKIEFVKSKEQVKSPRKTTVKQDGKTSVELYSKGESQISRMTHPSPKRNMVPKAVLMRSGLVSLTTAKPVNTAQPKTTVNSARPMTNVFNKAHSTVRRPINNKTTTKNSNFNQKVNTASSEVLNQTFDRLQKLISQLEIHGESISQEDMNQKFLRSSVTRMEPHIPLCAEKLEIDTLKLG